MAFCKKCHKRIVKDVENLDNRHNICVCTGFEVAFLTSGQLKNIAGNDGRGTKKRLKKF